MYPPVQPHWVRPCGHGDGRPGSARFHGLTLFRRSLFHSCDNPPCKSRVSPPLQGRSRARRPGMAKVPGPRPRGGRAWTAQRILLHRLPASGVPHGSAAGKIRITFLN